MSRTIFINDRLVPEAEARISVFDHGLLYGDGVFEGLRSYAGRVFRLDAHLDRLWASARAICLEIPLAKEALAKAVIDTLMGTLRDSVGLVGDLFDNFRKKSNEGESLDTYEPEGEWNIDGSDIEATDLLEEEASGNIVHLARLHPRTVLVGEEE